MKRLALAALPLAVITACGGSSSDAPKTTAATSSSTSTSTATSSSTTNSSSSAAASTTTPTSSSISASPASSSTTPPTSHQGSASPSAPKRRAAAKTATCTNLGTGKQYPCTPAEYAAMNAADEPGGPTLAQCRNKLAPADYTSCLASGYVWGMTGEEMREHDKGATCATGSQIYWVEHNCYTVKSNGNVYTYSDGSVQKF